MSKATFSNNTKLKLNLLYLQLESHRPDLTRVLKDAVKLITNEPYSDKVELSKSAIIKKPVFKDEGVVEKGIILLGFEYQLKRLISLKTIDSIANQYYIFFMPTWQPFYSIEFLSALKKIPDSLVLLPSSQDCYYKALFNPSIKHALPFHASSWVAPSLYSPRPKNIDILMVANFGTYKRHYLLFEALKMLPENLKVVLAGRPLGARTSDVLLNEAKHYGVENRFELMESPSDEKISELLCQAKLVLGLSGREGSYVSLAEALFANTPVALFRDAVVGTKNYINPKTGFLLQPDLPLAPQLEKCLALSESLEPRKWAIKNISNIENIDQLNHLIQSQLALKETIEAFKVVNFEVQVDHPENYSMEYANLEKLGLYFKGMES